MNTHEIFAEIHTPPCHLPQSLEEQIRHRAYQIWREQGEQDNCALDHWLKAEAEILSHRVFNCIPPAALMVH